VDSTEKYSEIKNLIGFYGSSPEIDDILGLVMTVAPTDLSVLIIGESGTGKELVANAIHHLSKRKDRAMISVNTGAIPEGILESELFGHEKGSFTGAVGMKKGYFEAADNGTIFLDEIGEMSLNTQVKLLRVLEESEFMRVGGTNTIHVDVRIVAATNKNLETAVKHNEFRRDLYFRLKAITIEIPPLRRRKQDIPVLIQKFTELAGQAQKISFKGFSPEAVSLMQKYDWPGNVRELRNFIESALILNRGEIVTSEYVTRNLNLTDHETMRQLPVPLNLPHDQAEREIIYRTLLALKLDINEIKQMMLDALNHNQTPVPVEYSSEDFRNEAGESANELRPSTLASMERELIKDTLKKFEGSRRKAARALQISERTLYRKIREYGI
jgi:DNA-binding NtrC family response regulator